MKSPPLTIATCFIAILLTCASGNAISAQLPTTTIFSVSIVPQFDSRKIHKIWHPILKALEKSTGYKFKLQSTPTIPVFEKEFNTSHFDCAYMNPYHAQCTNSHQDYIPLVHDIEKRLQGILVVKKIEKLAMSYHTPSAYTPGSNQK